MKGSGHIKGFGALCVLVVSLLMPPPSLADARADGERGIAEFRKGNLIEAMQILEQSAAAGYPPAQTTLAFILDSAERDAEAFRWYQKAAESADAAGLFGLAGMYAKGEGTEKDPARARQLMLEAAQLGHVQAMRVYANALEHGLLDLEASPQSAATWYLNAAELGDELSIQRLIRAYTQGQLGLPADARQAGFWQEKLDQPD